MSSGVVHIERERAARAAAQLRGAWGDPGRMGQARVVHIDLSRPRRAVWLTTWENLPGFRKENGQYAHELLPGWGYTAAEVWSEMIPDLERLAATGERPTEATR